VPDGPSDELVEENAALRAENGELKRMVAVLTERIAELERRLAADSSNSSRPPSSDAPWDKKPAKKRSSRTKSGRKPGKQPGAPSASRSLVDDPDDTKIIQPNRCGRCDASLDGAAEHSRQRRQAADRGADHRPPGRGDRVNPDAR
jgi:transposase